MKALVGTLWKALNSFYRALVVMSFFNWFIASSLGLSQLGFWLTFVMILTFNIVRLKPNVIAVHYQDKNETRSFWAMEEIKASLAMSVALSLILLIGWIVKLSLGM